MITWLWNRWNALRSSYWFIPGLLALGATALAFTTLALDRGPAGDALRRWAYPGGPEGARAILTTIASSMIGVAGVVFSITVVALTMASAQLGPRLLRTFLRDRGNQVVLGGFISIFLYCLLALRAVSSNPEFVPAISVTTAVALALFGVALLIYFVHHATVSLQADQVVAEVAQDLLAAIDRFTSEGPVAVANVAPEEAGSGGDQATPSRVTGDSRGYIQAVDYRRLYRIACDRGVVIRALERPGRFVTPSSPLVAAAEPLDEEARASVRESFIVGPIRTEEQDVEYALNQLVEVALRALSPGINDPFTALACVDWLGAALGLALGEGIPAPVWCDDSGSPRLIRCEPDFARLVGCAFDQLRQSARDTPAVRDRMLETLADLARQAGSDEERGVIRRHAELVHAEGREGTTPADASALADRFREVSEALGLRRDGREGGRGDPEP